jgi:hypothetical protein
MPLTWNFIIEMRFQEMNQIEAKENEKKEARSKQSPSLTA